MTADMIIKGGMCVTPGGIVRADIAVFEGRIIALGNINDIQAKQTLDASGLHIIPGVIDSQCHFREPGAEHKEDFDTATEAAVIGGVTGIFEMPNTNPSTTCKEAFEDKIRRMEGRSHCHHAFYIGADGSPEQDLAALERLPGCAGVKIFMGSSTGSLLVEDDHALEAILRKINRRCAVHCEDEPRLRERKHIAEELADPSAHPIWRDEETAIRATTRLLRVARGAGAKIHVLHVTTAEEALLLGENKDIATMECLPQHLTFSDADYADLGSRLQMNPPIRAARHRDGLWQAVQDGTVDIIATDHAPHTLEEKAKPYPQSPSGMPGVQTLVPVMLDHVNAGRLSLERLVDLICAAPAKIFGLERKGRIARGYDADLTLVDMQGSIMLSDEDMKSKCGWTPYANKICIGKPVYTLINGKIAAKEGVLEEVTLGRPYQFM